MLGQARVRGSSSGGSRGVGGIGRGPGRRSPGRSRATGRTSTAAPSSTAAPGHPPDDAGRLVLGDRVPAGPAEAPAGRPRRRGPCRSAGRRRPGSGQCAADAGEEDVDRGAVAAARPARRRSGAGRGSSRTRWSLVAARRIRPGSGPVARLDQLDPAAGPLAEPAGQARGEGGVDVLDDHDGRVPARRAGRRGSRPARSGRRSRRRSPRAGHDGATPGAAGPAAGPPASAGRRRPADQLGDRGDLLQQGRGPGERRPRGRASGCRRRRGRRGPSPRRPCRCGR